MPHRACVVVGACSNTYGICYDGIRRSCRNPCIQQRNDLLDSPDAIGDSSFHRRSDPQALVNPSEIIVHVTESNMVSVILDFL